MSQMDGHMDGKTDGQCENSILPLQHSLRGGGGGGRGGWGRLGIKKKKKTGHYLSMRNPYMKFQNPSMHSSQEMACIRFHSDFFKKGHNSRKGDNSGKNKTSVGYFSMRSSYMKFQNPRMHGS